MHLAPAVVKVFIIIFNLLIGIMIFLAFMPLIPGNVNVDIPGQDSWTSSWQGSVMTVQAPLRVYNGGVYDFNQLSLELSVQDPNSGIVVAQDSSQPINIVAGRWTTVPLAFEVDVDLVPADALRAILFTDHEMTFSVGLQVKYVLDLISAQLHFEMNNSIGPLLSNFTFDPSTARMQTVPGGVDLVIPFHFSSSPLLQGQSVSVHGQMSNATATLSDLDTTVMVQQQTNTELRFRLSNQVALHLASSSDTLYFDITPSFHAAQFTEHYQYDWNPPGP